MSDIQTLMRSANPIPDVRSEFGQEDLDALQLLTQRRSGDMDLKETPAPVVPEKQNRRGWFVAAAAFAGVILVLAVAALLARSTDEAPPATTPPTTQAAPPTTEAEALTATTVAPIEEQASEDAASSTAAAAMVGELVTAVNEGDGDAIRQFFAAANSVVSSDSPDPDDRARVTDRWVTWSLLDSSAEIVECRQLSSGPTRCEIARTSPFDVSADGTQVVVVQLASSADGGVDLMRIDFATGAWAVAESAFADWVTDNRPDEFAPMFLNFSDPELTAELWREIYPEWAEAQS